MRLLHQFLKKNYSNEYSTGVTKSLIFRLKNLTEPNQPLQKKLSRFLRTFFIPVFLILKAKKTNASHFIVDNFSLEKHYERRKNFIRHFQPALKDVTIEIIDGEHFFYKKWTLGLVLKVLQVWWKFSWLAFLNILRPTENYSNLHFHKVANNLINIILLEPKEVYYFYLFTPTSYLSAFLSQKRTKVNVSISNSMVYPSNRYTHLTYVELILCSKYQIEEVHHLNQLNWINTRLTTYWGPEEIEDFQQIKKEEATFDIGIYSRADWARDYSKRMMRASDLTKIANYDYADNVHANNFEAILKTVVQHKPVLKVKIYLHPFERDLYNNHQIKPSYWQLVEDFGVKMDTSGGNSISKIYECTIGIGTFSTIIMDRWNEDLGAFALFNEKEDGYLCRPEFLGKYGKNFFSDMKDLEQLLKEKL